MTYFSKQSVTLADGPQLDAFNRARVSSQKTQLDISRIGTARDDLVDTITSGDGAASYLANESTLQMSVTSSGRVVSQSKRYTYYQPGKSLLTEITGVLDTDGGNVRSRVGLFDDDNDKTVDSGGNGFFFQNSNGALSVVRRSYTSGTQTDTSVAQASWNLDTLDGNGPSGITLDESKTNIFVIDLQWLGVGRCRMGVVIDGVITYCHQWLHAGILDAVYMTSANLPVRWEIESLGGAGTMKAICATVQSEGGFDPVGSVHSVSTGTTAASVTTGAEKPLIAVRSKDAFCRTAINPIGIGIMIDDNQPMLLRGYLADSVTGGSWSSASDGSEVNSTMTSFTGTEFFSTYISDKIRETSDKVVNRIFTGSTIAGAQQSILLSGIALTQNISSCYSAIDYQEVR